jgi:hypothetical protein
MKQLFRIYWLAALSTLLIWIAVAIWGGWGALWTVLVLTLLEVTFSADNAVVNSKVLVTMSPFWQKLFMTVGIFIAVFVMRFFMPLVIVMITAGLGLGEVVHLALNDAAAYEHHLHIAEPLINAFGGTFLLMIALSYFIDYEKKTHWLAFLERRLGKLGALDNVTVFLMLLAAVVLYATMPHEHQAAVLLASIVAVLVHVGLNLLNSAFTHTQRKNLKMKQKVGWAAFSAFLYLEILDASFSLDGVIGAFAITSSVVLIMAGLGAGAVWVRAMTIHLVRAKTLSKYVYLESGAHWAIGFLGAVMLLKLYHVHPPEWLIGGLGLGVIGLAIWWSKHQQKQGKSPA